MATFFRTKAKFSEINDQGLVKLVTREYLIQASSWTEAEARTYEFLGETVRGDFEIKKVNDTPIENVIIEDTSDTYWLVKVKYPLIDDGGKEKYATAHIVVTAGDISSAITQTQEQLAEAGVRDFETVAATLTKITEFYPYQDEVDEEEEGHYPDPYSEEELNQEW